jgi:DNA-binding IclR family transcriptional regulator
MGTIGKALTLLDILSGMESEAGLTEIALACGYDKATTRRFLVELEKHGFVEQHAESRKYHLGSAPVRLARIREARYPLLRTALSHMKRLVGEVDETVHLAEYSANRLSTVHVEDSSKAHRVFVDVGTVLPFHATASGLAFIAACPPAEIEAAIAGPLEAFTGYTMTDAEAFRRNIAETQANGYSIGRQGMEVGVVSAAAAIRAPGTRPIGTLAVAAPASRTDDAAIREFGTAVAAAAAEISRAFFGAGREVRPQTQARRTG